MEKPIIFNAEMVRAVLAGRKTQTRRPVRRQITGSLYYTPGIGWYPAGHPGMGSWTSPFGEPGGLLWVRETHHIDRYPGGLIVNGKPGVVHYRADRDGISQSWKGQWRPSIHMPRWASRLTLHVLRVWTERVQEIEKRDAIAEGVYWSEAFPEGYTWDGKRGFGCAEHAYFDLYGFDCLGRNNPLVWACEFEVVKGENSTTGA